MKSNPYTQSINKVLDYIDQNIESNFTLDALVSLTHFSKYHFHRIFCAQIGEPLFQYILRLRLEKCASNLLIQPKRKLSDIAFEFGFSDLSVFSRHFKKHFGISPSLFRDKYLLNSKNHQMNSNYQQILSSIPAYFCHESKQTKWNSIMKSIKNVTVQNLSAKTVAYIRNFGPYAGNTFSYEQSRNDLFAWAASEGLLAQPDFKYLIAYHDNPEVALNNHHRMSLCVTIPKELETKGIIGKMNIAEGSYLVCDCELAAEEYAEVWNWIYGYWFPNNQYIPDHQPYFELYHEEPQDSIHKVSFCVPVKMIST